MPFLGVLLLAVACTAPTPRDETLATQLQRLGLHYYLDEDGDFVVDLSPEPGRRQRVWIRSEVNNWNHTRIREIISLGRSFTQEPPRTLLMSLLEENYHNRFLGSWSLTRSPQEGTYLLVFVVKLNASPYNPLLIPALLEAASAADSLEKTLGIEDIY